MATTEIAEIGEWVTESAQWVGRYDVLVDLFVWLYRVPDRYPAYRFMGGGGAAQLPTARVAAELLATEFRGEGLKSPDTVAAEREFKRLDPSADTVDEPMDGLHGILWTSDMQRAGVRRSLLATAGLLAEWTFWWGLLYTPDVATILKIHTQQRQAYAAVVADHLSQGCLRYLLCAVRLGRVLIKLHRRPPAARPGGRTAAADIIRFGRSDPRISGLLAPSRPGYTPSDQGVAAATRADVLERFFLRMYYGGATLPPRVAPLAAEVRGLVAGGGGIHGAFRRVSARRPSGGRDR